MGLGGSDDLENSPPMIFTVIERAQVFTVTERAQVFSCYRTCACILLLSRALVHPILLFHFILLGRAQVLVRIPHFNFRARLRDRAIVKFL